MHTPIGTQALYQVQAAAAFGFEVGQLVIASGGSLQRLVVPISHSDEHSVGITGQSEPHRRQMLKLS